MWVPSSSSHAMSLSRPSPEYVLSRIAVTRFVPTRQGTQIAQFSFARYAKSVAASFTMHVPAAIARTCADPMWVPATRRSSKSSRVSSRDVPRIPPVGPPTCTPFSFPVAPPASLRISPS